MNEWINCEDKNPEIGREYLFYNAKKEITFGEAFDIERNGFVWIHDRVRVSNELATHFMQLPKPPEEQEG